MHSISGTEGDVLQVENSDLTSNENVKDNMAPVPKTFTGNQMHDGKMVRDG